MEVQMPWTLTKSCLTSTMPFNNAYQKCKLGPRPWHPSKESKLFLTEITERLTNEARLLIIPSKDNIYNINKFFNLI